MLRAEEELEGERESSWLAGLLLTKYIIRVKDGTGVGFIMLAEVIKYKHNFGRKPKENILITDTIMHRDAAEQQGISKESGCEIVNCEAQGLCEKAP